MNGLTKDLLSGNYQSEKKDGWYASFYDDGQLKEYGYYRAADVPSGWSIYLGHNDGTARVEYHETHPFPDPARQSAQKDGFELEKEFHRWGDAQIDRIVDKAFVLSRCSFCQKYDDQVRKIINGPNVLICNECVDFCAEIVQHPD